LEVRTESAFINVNSSGFTAL